MTLDLIDGAMICVELHSTFIFTLMIHRLHRLSSYHWSLIMLVWYLREWHLQK